MNGARYRQVVADLTAVEAEARGLIAAADAAGDFTPEQTARLTELREKKNELTEQKTSLEAFREEQLRQPAVASVGADPGDEDDEEDEDAPTPFRTLGEQLRAVQRTAVSGRIDPRLAAIQEHAQKEAAAAGANEAVGSEGGFLVQKDFSNELLRSVHETGILSRRARRVPVSGNGLKMNAVDERSRADGSRWGGVQVFWTAEAEDKTASKPKFRQIDMSLQKLAGLLYATDELLEDPSALEAVAREAFPEEFGFKVDDAMMRGTGAGMPLGILNSGALVSVAKEAAQTAATIVAANLYKMLARMPAGSLPFAAWFINVAAWVQIFTLQDANGNNLYFNNGNLQSAPFGTLLGIPIVPIEHAEALGTKGDILLADWRQYLLIEKAGGIKSASSIHVRFVTDETTFRWVLRTNGQPIPVSAITPYKGADTLSPFITLDTRA